MEIVVVIIRLLKLGSLKILSLFVRQSLDLIIFLCGFVFVV